MYTKHISLFRAITLLAFCSIVNATESVPSPTKLEVTLRQMGSVIASEVELGTISTSKAELGISEISVKTGQGDVLKGIKIHLSDISSSDVVFLESERVSIFIQELKEIGNCQRHSACVGYFGIARCRPSQPEPQAYCLENYKISESDYGTLIRTPKGWFKLNQILATTLIEVVNQYGKSSDGGT